ncbi:type II toxin-antitoxin system Phd/YefM family antitoxin [Hyphobacterium marinum]|uniref:Antitoxin n=1 Tax=Hyphobacterium marinum TaxID=3116574 RepID=A0ABU7M099_9PROT|nr:type II toxin-antitoxin system prevent-host-death family antitoxin [Hyphobacterium sp. Y6023]MEE2566685.1 type II toxin-antitoxin system prevent-host-death family antitoxin [Hyphobacterium sp. Y6023]
MREVGVLEAKTHLSKLIEEIEATGEEIVITRHGKPVVRLSRAAKASRPMNSDELLAKLKAFRNSQMAVADLDQQSWEELKEAIRS